MGTRLELLVSELASLDLTDAEAEYLAVDVNVSLARISAEREWAGAVHVVPHAIVETTVRRNRLVARQGKQVAEAFDDVDRTNQRDTCPDCGRGLVAARDHDTPVPALVCARLHGVPLAPAGLTAHDIIACGRP